MTHLLDPGLVARVQSAASERYSAPDARLARRLVASLGREGAHRAVDSLVSKFSVVELAALAGHAPMWMRPKQRPPATSWRSWGFLTSRGWGKSHAIASWITEEVQAGRAMRIGLAAQSEAKTLDAQVAPLLEVAPPWFRPTWEVSSLELTWPNGATARAFTPEVPGAIRSENLWLAWLSEIQSWPRATMEEAYSNFVFATRVGNARTVWDATPKRAHPLLKRLLSRAEDDGDRHIVTRGVIYENPHLSLEVLADMEREYHGTSKGREELLGEMLDEADGALVKQKWIEDARRPMPSSVVRRIISVDPATTSRAGSDRTGMVDIALSPDGQLLVCGNHTAKMRATEWIGNALKLYVDGRCDLLLIETNKGGDLLFDVIALEAQKRGMSAVRIGKSERPTHSPKIVNVREVYGQGPKEDRAQPMATAYERGRVSHVEGVDLSELEDSLTTWEPEKGMRSPDALDALAHGAVELFGSSISDARAKSAFVGITEVGMALAPPARPSANVATLLGGGRVGGRI